MGQLLGLSIFILVGYGILINLINKKNHNKKNEHTQLQENLLIHRISNIESQMIQLNVNMNKYETAIQKAYQQGYQDGIKTSHR